MTSSKQAVDGVIHKAYWAYRVGNYRLICHIQRQQTIVLALEIEHLGWVYR